MTHTLRQTNKLVDLQCQNVHQLFLSQDDTPEHSPWLVIILLRESDEVGREHSSSGSAVERSFEHFPLLIDVLIVVSEGRMFIP
jgi:hypothetical protein